MESGRWKNDPNDEESVISRPLFAFQSGRIELPSETLLIVPDDQDDVGADDFHPRPHRVYKSKLLSEDLIFENVLKGSDL